MSSVSRRNIFKSYPLHPYTVKIKDFLETFQGKKDVTSVFADIDLDGDEDESADPKRCLKYIDQLVRVNRLVSRYSLI